MLPLLPRVSPRSRGSACSRGDSRRRASRTTVIQPAQRWLGRPRRHRPTHRNRRLSTRRTVGCRRPFEGEVVLVHVPHSFCWHFRYVSSIGRVQAPNLKPAQRSQQLHEEVCCAHSADSKKNSESHLFTHSSPAPIFLRLAFRGQVT